MGDDDATSRYGLDEPVFGFMGEGSAVADVNPDQAAPPADNPTQPFYGSTPNWDFQASPPFDAFDVSSAGTAPSTQAASAAASWPMAPFDQPQTQSRPPPQIASPAFDAFSPSNAASTPVFGTASEASNQGKPPTSAPDSQAGPMPAMTREELRNLAMPPHLQYHSPRSESSPESANTESKLGPVSSPDMTTFASKKDTRKRKIPDEDEDEDEVDEEDKPVKKTAHNMIEKRYRTNINDKIAALRDSVPSLRIMSKSARGEDTTEDREELHGLTPAHKLNKATVLSKATEYIRHLEKRNGRLLDENNAIKERIVAFEKLFMTGAMNGSISPMQQPPTPMSFAENRQQFPNSPVTAPQDGSTNPAGMIQVPDDMKRIISAQMAAGQPYPVPQQPFRGGNPAVVRQQQIQQQQQQQQQQMQQNGWVHTSPYFGKLMVGSLAGLMILDSFRENEVSNEKPEGRGLFALPAQLLGRAASALDLHIMGCHAHTSLKLILFLGIFLWFFVPSLFASARGNIEKQQAASLRRAPSLASPIHVRRQAWLTAIQTVWVPRHNFFLEAAALVLKTMKLSLRNTIGNRGFQMLTGLTEEQETARIKAWSIALDSQLAGGDVDICKSRLVLTLIASGTLPASPIRLMTQALHIRLLLWDMGNKSWQLGAINAVAAKLSRTRWNEARQLNRLLVKLRHGASSRREEELPDHLVALLEQDCDEVLSPSVIQRAHNLAFNEDTAHEVASPVDGMDSVVDDMAVGTPMDAVAAWRSTEVLHGILSWSLGEEVGCREEERRRQMELAIKVAPVGSMTQIRAMVARAVLEDDDGGAHLAAALQATGSCTTDVLFNGTALATRQNPDARDRELRLALLCALGISLLERGVEGPDSELLGQIVDAASDSMWTSTMTLLGCAACVELMRHLGGHQLAREECEAALGKLSSIVRLWMGRSCASRCGVEPAVRGKVIDRCLTTTKHLAGPDTDTGYGSLSEGDV